MRHSAYHNGIFARFSPTVSLCTLYIAMLLYASLAMLHPVFATGSRTKTAQVLGFVQNCSENLPFVPVTATCGTQTLSAQTGSTGGDNGKYSITFRNASCKKGSTVTVTADGITNTGTIGTFFWFPDIAEVNLQTGTNCPPPTVPEFGLVTGVIALATSFGAFAVFRRKIS